VFAATRVRGLHGLGACVPSLWAWPARAPMFGASGVRINGTGIRIMLCQSLSYASLELYLKTLSPSCGRVASLCGGRGRPHPGATPPGSVDKDRGRSLPSRCLGNFLTHFAPVEVSASLHPGEGLSAPPESTMFLPRYCSYFTSHRYVVYSPTKKGWSFG
jgi:hypothetical protein